MLVFDYCRAINPFAITVVGKKVAYSEGISAAPTATVEMAASYLENTIINNCSVDFDVPEFFLP